MPAPRLSPKADTRASTALADAFRDAAEAGIQYYARLGRLAVDLTEALLPAGVELQRRAPSSEPGGVQPVEAAPTIVLEAEAGKRGLGVFMVENTTAETVSGALTVSDFQGPSRKKVHPAVSLSPDVVSLDPGDQVLVQVAALVDETLDPGVRYRAEISVPTLSGTRIPLVVRRSPGAAPSAKKRAPAKKGSAAKAPPKPRRSTPRRPGA